jgi:hypothetical protein
MDNTHVTYKNYIFSNKKINEDEHKHRKNVEKGRSIKKEIKPCTHIHIICKLKINKMNKKCILKDVVEMPSHQNSRKGEPNLI